MNETNKAVEDKTEIISELTPEMEARIPEVRDAWINYGLNCNEADKPRAAEGVKTLYVAAGFEPPTTIEWVQSPLEGIKLAAQWSKGISWDNAILQEMEECKCTKAKAKKNILAHPAGFKEGDSIPWALPYGHPFLPEVTKEEMKNQNFHQCYGQHDASWLSFYYFFKKYLPEQIKPLEGHFEIAKSAHWWWAYEGAVIFCNKAEYLYKDDDNRLHCEDGPAVKYRDPSNEEESFKVYVWHGVRVPAWIIETPEKMTVQNIMAESNQEIRRAMIEKYDFAKFLKDAGSVELQSDQYGALVAIRGLDQPTIGKVGELIDANPLEVDGVVVSKGKKDVKDDTNIAKYVVVKDHSTDRMYALGVPPETITAHQGVAWTFGFDNPLDYQPQQQS